MKTKIIISILGIALLIFLAIGGPSRCLGNASGSGKIAKRASHILMGIEPEKMAVERSQNERTGNN